MRIFEITEIFDWHSLFVEMADFSVRFNITVDDTLWTVDIIVGDFPLLPCHSHRLRNNNNKTFYFLTLHTDWNERCLKTNDSAKCRFAIQKKRKWHSILKRLNDGSAFVSSNRMLQNIRFTEVMVERWTVVARATFQFSLFFQIFKMSIDNRFFSLVMKCIEIEKKFAQFCVLYVLITVQSKAKERERQIFSM